MTRSLLSPGPVTSAAPAETGLLATASSTEEIGVSSCISSEPDSTGEQRHEFMPLGSSRIVGELDFGYSEQSSSSRNWSSSSCQSG